MSRVSVCVQGECVSRVCVCVCVRVSVCNLGSVATFRKMFCKENELILHSLLHPVQISH